MLSPQHVDEEAQTKHAVDDGRHARQVDHRDADDLGQAVLARILAGRPPPPRRGVTMIAIGITMKTVPKMAGKTRPRCYWLHGDHRRTNLPI